MLEMRLSDLRADLTQVDSTEFVGGVYPRRHLCILASQAGLGKTWLILRHSLDIANGLHMFLGEDLAGEGKALIFCGETGAGIVAERLKLLGADTIPEGLVMYTLTDFNKNKVPITLDTHDGLDTFARIVEGEKADVVFIDTLISFRSEDENDQKSTAALLGNLRTIAENNNCCIVISHHLRKRKARDRQLAIVQDDIIGTSAFMRLASIAYVLAPVQFSKSISFTCIKSWWKKPYPRAWSLESSYGLLTMSESIYEDEEQSMEEKAESIVENMSPSTTTTIESLSKVAGCSETTARQVIRHAVEKGVLKLHWVQDKVKYYIRIIA